MSWLLWFFNYYLNTISFTAIVSNVTQSSIIFSYSSYYLHSNNWLHVSLIHNNYIRPRFHFLILEIANLNLTFGFFLYAA